MNRVSIMVEGLDHGTLPIPTASRLGPFLATGGIRGVERRKHELSADPAVQIECMFENLDAVLRAGGASLDRVLKITIWVKDSALRPVVDSAWVKYFPDPASRPARHLLIYDLPGRMAIQCEALAVCP
jgi:2-iminobutanoate/2-iminopropanoate deaminase